MSCEAFESQQKRRMYDDVVPRALHRMRYMRAVDLHAVLTVGTLSISASATRPISTCSSLARTGPPRCSRFCNVRDYSRTRACVLFRLTNAESSVSLRPPGSSSAPAAPGAQRGLTEAEMCGLCANAPSSLV
jgi:hypothetical protein